MRLHNLPVILADLFDDASPTTVHSLLVEHDLTLFGHPAKTDIIVIAWLDFLGEGFFGQFDELPPEFQISELLTQRAFDSVLAMPTLANLRTDYADVVMKLSKDIIGVPFRVPGYDRRNRRLRSDAHPSSSFFDRIRRDQLARPARTGSRAENHSIAYQSVFPSALETIASETAFDLLAELDRVAPFMAERVRAWLEAQFGTAAIGDLFGRADAFPVLLFPWWLDASTRDPDPAFHRDIATSTISGYLYIRLIDNLMDGDAPADVGLLPALGFFHSKFTEPYHSHFASGHPFWTDLLELWVETAEVTMRDHALHDIDRNAFERISARKTGAAKIPIAAVAHSLKRTDLLPDWYRLVDVFGCWHQMLNDVFGWPRDLRHGAITYFLSEASRETTSGETVEKWIARKGFGWAIRELDRWMDELRELADKLGSKDLHRYLDKRRALLDEQAAKVRRGFEALENLGELVGRQGRPGPAGD